MPKAWKLQVAPWPAFREGSAYLARVLSVEKSAKPKGMRVELAFCDKNQIDRRGKFVLPAELRPDNLPARLLRAAGLDVRVGAEVMPRDAKGALVRVVFGTSIDGTRLVPIDFKPAKEKNDARPSE